jgi:hypothetical protein
LTGAGDRFQQTLEFRFVGVFFAAFGRRVFVVFIGIRHSHSTRTDGTGTGIGVGRRRWAARDAAEGAEQTAVDGEEAPHTTIEKELGAKGAWGPERAAKQL